MHKTARGCQAQVWCVETLPNRPNMTNFSTMGPESPSSKLNLSWLRPAGYSKVKRGTISCGDAGGGDLVRAHLLLDPDRRSKRGMRPNLSRQDAVERPYRRRRMVERGRQVTGLPRWRSMVGPSPHLPSGKVPFPNGRETVQCAGEADSRTRGVEME